MFNKKKGSFASGQIWLPLVSCSLMDQVGAYLIICLLGIFSFSSSTAQFFFLLLTEKNKLHLGFAFTSVSHLTCQVLEELENEPEKSLKSARVWPGRKKKGVWRLCCLLMTVAQCGFKWSCSSTEPVKLQSAGLIYVSKSFRLHHSLVKMSQALLWNGTNYQILAPRLKNRRMYGAPNDDVLDAVFRPSVRGDIQSCWDWPTCPFMSWSVVESDDHFMVRADVVSFFVVFFFVFFLFTPETSAWNQRQSVMDTMKTWDLTMWTPDVYNYTVI